LKEVEGKKKKFKNAIKRIALFSFSFTFLGLSLKRRKRRRERIKICCVDKFKILKIGEKTSGKRFSILKEGENEISFVNMELNTEKIVITRNGKEREKMEEKERGGVKSANPM